MNGILTQNITKINGLTDYGSNNLVTLMYCSNKYICFWHTEVLKIFYKIFRKFEASYNEVSIIQSNTRHNIW